MRIFLLVMFGMVVVVFLWVWCNWEKLILIIYCFLDEGRKCIWRGCLMNCVVVVVNV